jgi:hypothetical protein
MSETRVGDEFSVVAGKRELQVFLLKDAERQEFRKMEEAHDKEQADLRRVQEERRPMDLERAKDDIRTEHLKPALRPGWRVKRETLRASELQMLADHRVDARNQRESKDLAHVQRQREDEYLARNYEERILRHARVDKGKERGAPSRERRDFDNARDRER